MVYDENNIFARIIKEEIPCNKIYEDEHNLAFYDINPQAKIHVLVIPKGPYIDFDSFMNQASVPEIQSFFASVVKVCEILGVKDDGYRILANKGDNGGQEVPHFHMHIFAGEKLGKMV